MELQKLTTLDKLYRLKWKLPSTKSVEQQSMKFRIQFFFNLDYLINTKYILLFADGIIWD